MMDPSPSDVKKGAGLTQVICANVNANAGMFISHVWLVMALKIEDIALVVQW